MRLPLKISVAIVASLGLLFSVSGLASADSFNQNSIISTPVFDYSGSMNPAQIDAFLNGFANSCISSNSGFRAIDPNGYNPTNGFLYGGYVTAGQAIYDAAQAYGLNPQVLITTLEKEQSLVTGRNNFSGYCNNGDQHKYAAAVGYGCPDSGTTYSYTGLNLYQRNGVTVTNVGPTCVNSAIKAGFSQQIIRAAWLLKFGEQRSQGNINWAVIKGSWNNSDDPQTCYGGPMTQGTWQRCPSGGSAYYDGYTTIDNTAVHMDSGPTAALYWYTPHFAGNQNFYSIFTQWFGSTQTTTPYSWRYVSQKAYSDSAMTRPLTGVPTVAPGAKLYAQLVAYNAGNQAWQQSNLHLGTSRPTDRTSIFYDASWLAPQRAASMQTGPVVPGNNATFNFTMQAPTTPGSYKEYFNLVADGITWLNDPGLYYPINVVSGSSTQPNQKSSLSAGQSLNPGENIISPEGNSVLVMQTDGNLVLYVNFKPIWATNTFSNLPHKLLMQTDGNLVLYDNSMRPLWNSSTSGYTDNKLQLQTDGNLVLYSSTNSPLWATYSVSNPSNLNYVNTDLSSFIFPGQRMSTADREYVANLQTDGNFVVLKNGLPVWATGTDSPSIGGKHVAFGLVQTDGNFVLYDNSWKPLWNSHTAGNGPSTLKIQPDGNLVLYTASTRPTWSIGTH
jgi:hypothetical protein